MEKAAGAGNRAGRRWELPSAHWAVVALALGIAAPAARAEPPLPITAAGVLAAQSARSGHEPPLKLQVEASSLPRLEAQDRGFQAPRVDISVFPNHQQTGLGAVFGMSGFSAEPGAATVGLPQQRPSFDVGLRWTQRLQSQRHVDITAWRRMNNDDDAYSLIQQQQPTYGARVELNLTPATRTGFAIDHGSIGVQFSGGGRLAVKRSNGHPMIYYRTSF